MELRKAVRRLCWLGIHRWLLSHRGALFNWTPKPMSEVYIPGFGICQVKKSAYGYATIVLEADISVSSAVWHKMMPALN